MNAKINIKTPAGQSLEGFPIKVEDLPETTDDLFYKDGMMGVYFESPDVKLHSGDIITIEIL